MTLLDLTGQAKKAILERIDRTRQERCLQLSALPLSDGVVDAMSKKVSNSIGTLDLLPVRMHLIYDDDDSILIKVSNKVWIVRRVISGNVDSARPHPFTDSKGHNDSRLLANRRV